MRFALVLLLSVAAALLLKALHLPGAWLFAALAVSATFALRKGEATEVPQPLYLAAQAAIGTALAGGFPSGLVPEWTRHAGLFAFAVLFILGASLANGYLLTRWTGLPPLTAFFGTLPGGAGAMAILADDLGADVRMVAAIQYIRILLILAALALFSALFGTPAGPHGGSGGGGAAPSALLAHGPFTWAGCGVAAGLALAGWAAAMWTPFPAAAFLVPIVLSLLLGLAGVKTGALPLPVLAAAYLAMGIKIGGRFQRKTLALLGKVLPAVCGTTALLLLAAAGLAWVLSKEMGIDLASAFLAATPGGLDSVAAVASDLHGDIAVVVAMQFARLLCVLLLGPWLARGANRFLFGATPPEKPNPTRS